MNIIYLISRGRYYKNKKNRKHYYCGFRVVRVEHFSHPAQRLHIYIFYLTSLRFTV